MAQEPGRFYALDVFRGATVALMILVNTPGSWQHIYGPLQHAPWHGCTPTDLVFPFFLFAVGNSLAFVMPRLRTAGTGHFMRKTTRRTLLIFAIGLLLNAFPFFGYGIDNQLVLKNWSQIRIMGVLQRIALCYFLASVAIYFLSRRQLIGTALGLLVLYWLATYLFGHGGDPYSMQGFWGTKIDKTLLGETHLYLGEGIPFDPEGLVSTLPAVGNALAGYLAGTWIISGGSNWKMLATLFSIATILLAMGYSWSWLFPINKKIWSSSYVLYTVGLAGLALANLIHYLELMGKRPGWASFFDVFGKNPLFIFVLSGVWARVYGLIRIPKGRDNTGHPMYQSAGNWLQEHLFAPLAGPYAGSLLYALTHLLLFWLICYQLHRRRIYIRV